MVVMSFLTSMSCSFLCFSPDNPHQSKGRAKGNLMTPVGSVGRGQTNGRESWAYDHGDGWLVSFYSSFSFLFSDFANQKNMGRERNDVK